MPGPPDGSPYGPQGGEEEEDFCVFAGSDDDSDYSGPSYTPPAKQRRKKDR